MVETTPPHPDNLRERLTAAIAGVLHKQGRYVISQDMDQITNAALAVFDEQLREGRAAERKVRILEAEIRWLESLADQPDELSAAAHKIATLEAQLTEARAAERELCAKVADEMRKKYRAEADLAGDQPTAQNNLRHSGLGAGAVAAAIRALEREKRG